ncbi:LptA/OstA family protein [Sphingomonas sp. MMS24-J13]|uniref:LptA/OstA family protein n=1 Tax=Sphingomonas sp. MMS24-J13 TaxID=3238686 RepID=UPI003850C96A
MNRRAAPLLLLSLLAGPLLAQAKGHDSNAPIDIASDRIEVQDRANRAIWVGNVHAVQGDMTMDAARMTVAYRKAAKPGADPEIGRIDASGNVVVVQPNERARGDFGIYDLDKKIITLIGNVSLVRDTNTVKGARLVIDLNTGRANIDGNAVAGPGGSTTSSGGRVTGHFTVPNRTTTPAATPPK